ncbi:hypothetical protein ['Paenibacillus yunnanensis' Narsing Rao et al. 2020]|uniref:hypothetical protein n=1 Tax=Paenibacillus tengchongensis TaxID=2608684 RepID=UPI0016524105|nr:hypothetical protein [Paenibacillus tengchongensis]
MKYRKRIALIAAAYHPRRQGPASPWADWRDKNFLIKLLLFTAEECIFLITVIETPDT